MPNACPSCNTELGAKEINGVQIHPCPNCGGVWFDHGKLQDLRAANADNLEELDEGVHGSVEPSNQFRALTCPSCNGVLSPYRYALDARIELDVCHDCRGIWVPQNELKILADTMKANRVDPPPVPQSSAVPSPSAQAGPPPPPVQTGPPPVTYHRTALDDTTVRSAPSPVMPAYGYGAGFGPGYGYGYGYMDGMYFRQSVAADIATVAAFTALDFLMW